MKIMKKRTTLVLIYNSFYDPLVQNLVLAYIKTLADHNNYKFYLVTYEQKKYWIDRTERKKIKSDLKATGIHWEPLKYHSGRFILIKKAYDFSMFFFLASYLILFKGVKLLFTFTNVAASMGIILSKLFRKKFLVYSYEPHSKFMAELGKWDPKGLKYKLLNRLENYAGLHGDYILTGTRHMVEDLISRGAKGKVFRAPTSVDENDFYFRPEARHLIRSKLGITHRKVLVYIGKFGDLYYKSEVFDLFRILHQNDSAYFFLIVTSNPFEEVKLWAKNAGIPDDSVYITGNLSFEQVKEYISASDLGLSAVPPSPSQKFRSPTKVGEYLLCGLPYITCVGVSEDDIYARQYGVGVVVNSFSHEDIVAAIPEIHILLKEEKESLRNRCRKIGIEYRAKTNIDALLQSIYNEIFVNRMN